MNAALWFAAEKPNHYVAALALDTIRNIVEHEPTVASVYCDKLLATVQAAQERLNSTSHFGQNHAMVKAKLSILIFASHLLRSLVLLPTFCHSS